MKKKIRTITNSVFATIFLYLVVMPTHVLADYADEPYRLRSFEDYFSNIMIAVWGLSIPYFIFSIVMVGFKYAFAFGDEQKLSGLKTRGGNLVIGFFLVFGGYFVVRMIMSLMNFNDPGGANCFSSPLGGQPIFQFFFPDVCAG